MQSTTPLNPANKPVPPSNDLYDNLFILLEKNDVNGIFDLFTLSEYGLRSAPEQERVELQAGILCAAIKVLTFKTNLMLGADIKDNYAVVKKNVNDFYKLQSLFESLCLRLQDENKVSKLKAHIELINTALLNQIRSFEEKSSQADQHLKFRIEQLLYAFNQKITYLVLRYLNHIDFCLDKRAVRLEQLASSQRRVICFDFDNTIFNSGDNGGYYDTYPLEEVLEGKHAEFAHHFYTGSKEEWEAIFKELVKLNFIIGICTSRYANRNDKCPLFNLFLNDLGDYIHPDYIIFTNGNLKNLPLLNVCQQNKIAKSHLMLVDDTIEHVKGVLNSGMQALHVNLVTDPSTFPAFKQELLNRAAQIVKSCDDLAAQQTIVAETKVSTTPQTLFAPLNDKPKPLVRERLPRKAAAKKQRVNQ